ncbi:cystathionine gamma-synthase family protein [Acidisphaera sp. L21]|uniref:cystathionine gamma-synthase family protein n=1 Tax=Acidisphaera sp. L21 TaxID=1641851 RepID=UPI00131D57C7|nr:cystathionine gamma-synthase family protein [Acidisphaera sp. L21]
MPDHSHTKTLGDRALAPETLMLGYGFDPARSEGSVKPPVFLTSTFAFATAEEGRDFFDVVAGRKPVPEGGAGLVYARFNHPNGEIVEDRLAVYEAGEAALTFSSGMAAITTAILATARPGDVILHSQPLYGGTETLLARTLANFGIIAHGFADGTDPAAIQQAADDVCQRGRLSLVMIETPSNPLDTMVDIAAVRAVADRVGQATGLRPLILCDNTMLSPVFQQPLRHGADLTIASMTKYIGGHSDLIGGAVVGSRALIQPIRLLRGAIGTQLDPHSCWLVGRSLETLAIRVRAAAATAQTVIHMLEAHPGVAAVHALGPDRGSAAAKRIYAAQCTGPGSTFSIEIRGGQAEAFQVLNRLRLFKLAVSLGGTESLVSHPASTTHSGVPADVRARIGVTDGLIRLSIGLESADDLIADLTQALAALDSEPRPV